MAASAETDTLWSDCNLPTTDRRRQKKQKTRSGVITFLHREKIFDFIFQFYPVPSSVIPCGSLSFSVNLILEEIIVALHDEVKLFAKRKGKSSQFSLSFRSISTYPYSGIISCCNHTKQVSNEVGKHADDHFPILWGFRCGCFVAACTE